jgi:hypothetical protein
MKAALALAAAVITTALFALPARRDWCRSQQRIQCRHGE